MEGRAYNEPPFIALLTRLSPARDKDSARQAFSIPNAWRALSLKIVEAG
jgi:hypothetical protein